MKPFDHDLLLTYARGAMINLVLYALILLGLLVGTWMRPGVALAGLLCVQVLDFWGQLASPLLTEYGRFTNLFMVGLVALGILRAARYPPVERESYPWFQLMLGCLLCYAGLSLLWSPAVEAGLGEWAKKWPYTVLNVLLIPLLFRRRIDMHEGLSAVLIFGTVLVTLSVALVNWDQRYIVSSWDPEQKFWNALAFAQLAGYVTLAAVLLNHKRGGRWAIIKYMGIAAGLALVVKSETRGQFFLMAVLPVIFLPMSRSVTNLRTYIGSALLVGCLACAAIYAYDTFGKEGDRWSSTKVQSDSNLRFVMAQDLLRHWWKESSRDPAVFIRGLGNSAAFSPKIVGFYPHVVSVEVLAEEGIIGFVLLLLLLWLSFRTTLRAYSLVKHDPIQRGVIATLAGCFAFAFLLSFKQGSLVGYGPEVFSFAVLLERYMATQEKAPDKPVEELRLTTVPEVTDLRLVRNSP